jgi:hypothetical protein
MHPLHLASSGTLDLSIAKILPRSLKGLYE